MDSENRLVERIGKALAWDRGISKRGRAGIPLQGGGGIRLGMGDDAAIIDLPGRTSLVLSCDSFVEGVHFIGDVHSADAVGFKSLARATSDLAAMGAQPEYFLMALVLGPTRTGKWLDEFLRGMRRAARLLGIRLIGGDTTCDAKVSIGITVIGRIAPRREVKRSGARAGDTIYVSGRLGQAELGLRLIQNGLGRKPKYRKLLQAHLYPRIRLALGAWLARNGVASAMMDLSDGLSTDLERLCEASGVGARLWQDRVPGIPASLSRVKLPGNAKVNSLELALHGGEDYELLFTVPSRLLRRLRKAPEFGALTAIGEITGRKEIVTVDLSGIEKPLRPLGWDPFRSQ